MENPFKRKCCLYTVIIQLSVAVLSGTALPVYAAASLHDLNGYVFYDHNHNGLKDEGDEGLTGITVVLEKVKFSRFKPAPMAVEEAITDRRGYYRFTKVEPFCLYKVQERSPQCCEMTTLDTAYIFITERSTKKEILFGHGNSHQPGLSAAEVPAPADSEDDTECLPDSECTANEQQWPEEPDIDLYDAVLEAVTGSCSQESLESLETFEPSAVRESLLEIDRDYKLLQWQSGLSRGHVIEAEYQSQQFANRQFDYSLYIPDSYTGDEQNRLPLFVHPAHPTTDPNDDIVLPWLAEISGERMIILTVNFWNHLMQDLDADSYANNSMQTSRVYHDYYEAIDRAIAKVKQQYYIDHDRVYIGGVSAVGNSAWAHGIFSADTYAAITPFSAGTAPFDANLYKNLLNVGILVVYGSEDELIPPDTIRPTLMMLQSWQFDLEYWEMLNHGHGTMFSQTFPYAVEWLFERKREIAPVRVHKMIMSPRQSRAYWLQATGYRIDLSEDLPIYPTTAPAGITATWQNAELVVKTKNITDFEVFWQTGDRLSPATGQAEDEVTITINGVDMGSLQLEEDATAAVQDYCRNADISRLWAGRLRLSVPARK